jgi:hypothetical protein
LLDGSGGSAAKSAGASFLRQDGTVWTTDKDGILLALLASEILAVTGTSPERALRRADRAARRPAYARVDAAANREQKAVLGKLVPRAGHGRPSWPASRSRRSSPTAPGNGAAIGGLKVVHRQRVVRGPAVGHRGRLQDLRRVLPRARAPGAGAGRGARGRQRGARRVTTEFTTRPRPRPSPRDLLSLTAMAASLSEFDRHGGIPL